MKAFVTAGWRVDPAALRLDDGTRRVRVGTRAMAVLCCLCERPGEVVTKEALMQHVWGDQIVTDDVLTVAVYELRKALDDRARAPRFIETIHGRGYRWLAPVGEADGEDGTTLPAAPAKPIEISNQRPSPWPRAAIAGTAAVAALLASWLFRVKSEESATASSEVLPTIAVLPLADDSPNAEATRVLADGVTDALIQGLARRDGVQVVSRTSVGRFRPPTDRSMPEIARELGADALVEGSVLRNGDDLQIALRLIDGASDRHLWAADYAISLGDLPSFQQRVSIAIRDVLHGGQAPDRLAADDLAPETRLEAKAIEAYLEGRQAYFQAAHSEATIQEGLRARSAFEQALALEPDFVDAHLSLAFVDLLLRWVRWSEPGLDRRIERSVQRALDLAPDLADTHRVLAEFAMVIDRDFEAAEASLRRALELRGSSGESYLAYGWLSRIRTDYAAAEAMAQRALHLDPLDPGPLHLLAEVAYEDGRPDEALGHLDRVGDLVVAPRWRLRGDILLSLGRRDEALRAYERLAAQTMIENEIVLGDLVHAVEDDDLEQVLTLLVAHSPLIPTTRAGFLVRLGRADEALDALEDALDDPRLLLVRTLPALRPLHGEPRFDRLLRQLGLAG